MKAKLLQIPEFLNSDPENIEQNDDGSVYIPIWQVENDLNYISHGKWGRFSHKYSFHIDHNGVEWLATSHELDVNYNGVKRILLCSSFISPLDYKETKNFIHTGIAEATKAGVKVLGKRFGRELNERTVLKPKTKKEPIKARPDNKVMAAYLKAVAEKDTPTIERLLKRYDIKTEKDYA